METQPAIINGHSVSTSEVLEVRNPSNGEVFAVTARGTSAHIDAAVVAARSASNNWSHKSPAARARILRGIAGAIRLESSYLSMLESRDTGKPLRQAKADVEVAAQYFDYYANAITTFFGDSLPGNDGALAYTRHVPYGVTGHIIPWNYPLQIACRTIAPSIAVGNCAVVKPAEDAPLTVIRLAQIAGETGLPPGVLNIVPGLGSEAGEALASHPDIDHLSFTGSVPIGSSVAQSAAQNVVPVALELGGKSPNIVFPDADLDTAVPVILKSMLQNAGQTCSAGSRLLVHEKIHNQVIVRLESALSKVTLGAGPDDPDLGPLISARQLNRVTELVERAHKGGAAYIGGPGSFTTPESGYFFPPTVFTDLDATHEIAREEVFGPVVATTVFKTTEEAIQLANGTEYGLIAAVWTQDIDTALALAEEIVAGQVYINTYGAGGGVEYTFGGFKKSGYGREKGVEALQHFCQTKTVIMKRG